MSASMFVQFVGPEWSADSAFDAFAIRFGREVLKVMEAKDKQAARAKCLVMLDNFRRLYGGLH
jgi:hypothetical protein